MDLSKAVTEATVLVMGDTVECIEHDGAHKGHFVHRISATLLGVSWDLVNNVPNRVHAAWSSATPASAVRKGA